MSDLIGRQEGATERLAEFVSEVTYSALPFELKLRLIDCFLDFVGISAFAAAHADSSGAIQSAIDTLDSEGSGTVIGVARGYSYLYAALLNGTFAHTLDFDDTNLAGTVHPGAPVISAALAVAERTNASGHEFLEALAAGYEVTCRIGMALGPSAYDRGFHLTSIAGVFGAVAAAAKLRKADTTIISNAFGLAGSQAAGSMQYLKNGAWNKRLHPGFAAFNGLSALALAEAGVIGAAACLEGQYGLLNGYTNAPRPEMLIDALGVKWWSLDTAIKLYPSCRFTHAAIEATLLLRDRVPVDVRESARLQLRLSKKAFQIVAERTRSRVQPLNIVDGQFSVYFQVAVAWMDGRCDWQSYRWLGSEKLQRVIDRIHVNWDAEMPVAGAELRIENWKTSALIRIDEPIGEPQRPMSSDQLEQKFLTMTVPVYGSSEARLISQRIQALTEETSMTSLIRGFRTRSAD